MVHGSPRIRLDGSEILAPGVALWKELDTHVAFDPKVTMIRGGTQLCATLAIPYRNSPIVITVLPLHVVSCFTWAATYLVCVSSS
jgi:hypothetical protein